MTELQTNLSEINEKLSDALNALSSVRMLEEAAKGDNGDFNDFFNRCYTAHLEGSSASHSTAQWAMLFTYFQDLCEQVSADTRNEMVAKMDEGTFSMDDLASYCQDAVEEIKSNIKSIEVERSKVIAQIARQTVLEAAA